ncbi:serine hydrolase domain-containing protein [Emticicia sp. 17c]|uniref:serine hydrolase domain-containing protein n=1 Tax=Emticicia sp. 17c TaxID=3127704 RepID=UPI00301CEB37
MKKQRKIIIASVLLSGATFFISCSPKFWNRPNTSYQPLPEITSLKKKDKINEAYQFLEKETQYDAFIALRNDSVLASWGDVSLPIMTHSARKSIMSVLYGIAIDKGLIQLNQTLGTLNIDDKKAPLTALEKTCTVRDLLMSRSGIYIEAAGETKEMKAARPKRGMHKPGEFFYYNNWGFNVLGTIFEQQTRLSIGEAIEEWLAKPLGMKKFRANYVIYKQPDYSEHRQYIIFMTAEDLARIGVLMLNNGYWKGKSIVSASWVAESTQPYSEDKGNEPFDHYAYLWLNDTDEGTFWASGWGGQFMIVDRQHKLVVVSRNDTGRSLLQQGLFMWKGKQASRQHHQDLHHLMITACQ